MWYNKGNGFSVPSYPPVAQLDRVADSDSEGRGFESLRADHAGVKSALLRRIFSGTVFFVVKDVFGIVFDIVGKI